MLNIKSSALSLVPTLELRDFMARYLKRFAKVPGCHRAAAYQAELTASLSQICEFCGGTLLEGNLEEVWQKIQQIKTPNSQPAFIAEKIEARHLADPLKTFSELRNRGVLRFFLEGEIIKIPDTPTEQVKLLESLEARKISKGQAVKDQSGDFYLILQTLVIAETSASELRQIVAEQSTAAGHCLYLIYDKQFFPCATQNFCEQCGKLESQELAKNIKQDTLEALARQNQFDWRSALELSDDELLLISLEYLVELGLSQLTISTTGLEACVFAETLARAEIHLKMLEKQGNLLNRSQLVQALKIAPAVKPLEFLEAKTIAEYRALLEQAQALPAGVLIAKGSLFSAQAELLVEYLVLTEMIAEVFLRQKNARLSNLTLKDFKIKKLTPQSSSTSMSASLAEITVKNLSYLQLLQTPIAELKSFFDSSSALANIYQALLSAGLAEEKLCTELSKLKFSVQEKIKILRGIILAQKILNQKKNLRMKNEKVQIFFTDIFSKNSLFEFFENSHTVFNDLVALSDRVCLILRD